MHRSAAILALFLAFSCQSQTLDLRNESPALTPAAETSSSLIEVPPPPPTPELDLRDAQAPAPSSSPPGATSGELTSGQDAADSSLDAGIIPCGDGINAPGGWCGHGRICEMQAWQCVDCSDNFQCRGLICVEGRCERCLNTFQCAPGTFCSPVSGICLISCYSNADCGLGHRCEFAPGADGKCVTCDTPDDPRCNPCKPKDGCPGSLHCIADRCEGAVGPEPAPAPYTPATEMMTMNGGAPSLSATSTSGAGLEGPPLPALDAGLDASIPAPQPRP